MTQRTVGTVVRGLRAPIIKEGDDICAIAASVVIQAAAAEGFSLRDRDVVAVTESVAARAQGNYATVDDIAEDVRHKFPAGEIGVVFPILSRNRFAVCLKAIARGAKKLYIQLSYPADEVGNHLITPEALQEKNVNPWSDVLDETAYRKLFGYTVHPFTGVDYVECYRKIVEEEGAEPVFIFSNLPETVLGYTKNVLCCDIHTRFRTKKIISEKGGETVIGLDEILSSPVNGSGYNEEYGLLGSNTSSAEKVKLLPRNCTDLVNRIQKNLFEKTGKTVEVMIYGDGAFKDPMGKIWELADPVVSPGYTDGLNGMPRELKLKYLADDRFANLKGKDLEDAVYAEIRNKSLESKDAAASLGTTPRRFTDLLGSLCDLTSGSGDKGTPIVLVQGYFDNISD